MPPGDNRYTLFPLFLAGVVFVLLAPIFWLHTETPAPGHVARGQENAELYHGTYPAYHYGFERLRNGELPLWNPKQYCGVPFLADPGHGLFQPLNGLFPFMSTERAMAVQAFLSLFLMGAFFVLCARAFEVHHIPAILGGIAYAFSGASASAMSRPELASALAWLPLSVWAVREFAREGRFAVAVLGGFIGAALLFSGSMAVTAAGLLLAGLCAAYHTVFRGGTEAGRGRLLTGYLVMILTGAGVGAAQWLPAAFWWRSLDGPGAAFWQFSIAGETPARLPDLVNHWLMAVAGPDMLPRVAYLGVVTLILLPAAFFHRATRQDAWFFAGAAAIFYVLGVSGQSLLGGGWPWAALLFPAAFCMAALAAIGADRLLATGRDPRSPLVWGPVLLALAIAAVVFYVSAAPVRGRLVLAVLALLPVLIVRARWLGAVCGLVLCGLSFVDLYSASVNYAPHPYQDAPGCYATHARLLLEAREQALDGRVLTLSQPLEKALTPNLGMITPLRMAGGSQTSLPKGLARWWEAIRGPEAGAMPVQSPLLDHMAVRALLVKGESATGLNDGGGAHWRPIRTDDGVTMYLNGRALPRAHWVPAWRAVRNVEEAIAALTAPEFDAARECVVEPGFGGLQDLLAAVPIGNTAERPDGLATPCTVHDDSAERVTVSLDAPQAGVVVLADTCAPGWAVRLDGQPARLLKANGVFRGVAVTAGRHEIVFVYRPWPVYAGFAVSLVTLAGVLLAGMAVLFRRR